MCLSNLVFLPPLIFLHPNFHENMHDFRPPPSFFQGRRLRPCFNGVDAPDYPHRCLEFMRGQTPLTGAKVHIVTRAAI